MTRDEWRRIKEIASGAWDQPEDARAAFVAQVCNGDEALTQQVASLLQSAVDASAMLEIPAFQAAGAINALDEVIHPRPRVLGSRIGPYRIVRELGHGGMGTVYLAERADSDFEQQVAVKFVAGAMSSDALARRFREERRILATLDHPNIARLFDGGTSPDGLPYVVMEYVDGLPIDAYCASRDLDVRARIELVQSVCGAVQYAHQRLVIHRDVKASNILVTPDGAPKLLDFGIATLANPGPTPTSRTLLRAHTLETASPEQVRGEPITVAADVYALGLLLFQLLTGVSPYADKNANEAELIRAICEDVMPPPSIVLGAGGSGRKRFERDLDLIVLKALRKEPDRRYQSAAQLADDLQRYLDGRPVLAAPDSTRYRATKFVRRHRAGVAAAGVALIALLGGAVVAIHEARVARQERARAEARFDDLRQLANTFLYDVHDAVQTLPGSTPVRRLLIGRVAEYLDRVSRDSGSNPAFQLEMAAAYLKVGDVLGNPYSANLGESDSAIESYRKAVAICEGLNQVRSNAPVRALLATSYHKLGDMAWAVGNHTAAIEDYGKALALRERLANDDPDSTRLLDLASSHYALGQSLRNIGDYDRSLGEYLEAARIRTDVVRRLPHDVEANRSLAATFLHVADVTMAQGDAPRAVEYDHRSIDILEPLARTQPADVLVQRALAISFVRLGEARIQAGDPSSGLADVAHALTLMQAAARNDPSNVQLKSDLAYGRRIEATALARIARWPEALAAIDASIAQLDALLAKDPNYKENLREEALGFGLRGDVLIALHKTTEGVASYRRGLAMFDLPSLQLERPAELRDLRAHANAAEQHLAASHVSER